jgi:transposase
VKQHALPAQILFDRFHIVVAAEEPLESQRRPERTSVDLGAVERTNRGRLLPQRSLSNVLRLQAAQRAREPLQKWMHAAMRSRLDPFKQFVRILRAHLDGILAWTGNAPPTAPGYGAAHYADHGHGRAG